MITFVIRGKPPFGGMQRRYARLAAFLASGALRGKVQLLVSRRALPAILDIVGHNSELHISTFDISGNSTVASKIRDSWSLIKALRKLESDQLFLCIGPGIFSFIASIFAKRSTYISMCMVDYTIRPNISVFSRIAGGISCYLVDRIDCLSPSLAEDLDILFFGLANRKVRVAPNSFTDISKIERCEKRDIDILMMARFMPEKGFDLISEIGSTLKDVNVHICGFGEYDFDKHNFKVYNSSNPFAQMARTRIFLSLQKINNYPSQSTLEAMASGCAIIATDVGETRLFLDEECAVLIPYDARELSYAIRDLLSDEVKLNNMGKVARERVLKYHTIERYADYFMENILCIK